MSNQVYATVQQLRRDLEADGFPEADQIFELYIRPASEWIEREFGNFIPITETKRFDGNGEINLFVPPLLAVTTLTDEGTTIGSTNYLLYPRDRHYPNGPYSRIGVDPDASALSVWRHKRDAITVAGTWGKYDETRDPSVTVADGSGINASVTSLLLSSAAKISVGATLKIGTEQVLVTALSTGSTITTNNGAIAIDDLDVTLADASGVNAGEVMQIGTEKMLVLVKSGNVVSVIRGYDRTEVQAHNTGQNATLYRTATIVRGINGTTAASHANGAAILLQVPPDPINFLARQIAGLMYKKARTGFSGRIANLEVGDVFYLDEFPNEAIDRIRRAYRC